MKKSVIATLWDFAIRMLCILYAGFALVMIGAWIREMRSFGEVAFVVVACGLACRLLYANIGRFGR